MFEIEQMIIPDGAELRKTKLQYWLMNRHNIDFASETTGQLLHMLMEMFGGILREQMHLLIVPRRLTSIVLVQNAMQHISDVGASYVEPPKYQFNLRSDETHSFALESTRYDVQYSEDLETFIVWI